LRSCFVCLSSLCILFFFIVLCIVSPSVYSYLSPFFVPVYRPLPSGRKPIAVNKYIMYPITSKRMYTMPAKCTDRRTREALQTSQKDRRIVAHQLIPSCTQDTTRQCLHYLTLISASPLNKLKAIYLEGVIPLCGKIIYLL
jgi:hypothetical protein